MVSFTDSLQAFIEWQPRIFAVASNFARIIIGYIMYYLASIVNSIRSREFDPDTIS